MADYKGTELNKPVDELSKQHLGTNSTTKVFLVSVNLNCYFDIDALVLKCPDSEYYPRLNDVPTVIMRKSNPESIAIIIASGMMICSAAGSEQELMMVTSVYVRALQMLDFSINLEDFNVQKIQGPDVSFDDYTNVLRKFSAL